MRIVAVRGENLASLADPFEIDFEREPLRSAGLFAITGETGAGKSTILDALCLALYDSFPRVESAGADAGALDSSGQTLSAGDPRSILRRGASQGFAEVDFLARDGLRYRARCELARARGRATGNLQQRARSLRQIDENGTPVVAVASGVEEVRRKIIELTELTFDQFRRTVLLAQGDFDAFLRADSKERAELLEKITGASAYALISQRIYQRTKQSENDLASLKRRLTDIKLLEEEERNSLSFGVSEAEQRRKELSNMRGEVLVHLRRYDAIATAEARLAQAEGECAAAKAKLAELAELRERLVLLERAEPLRALLDARKTAEAEEKSACDALERAEASVRLAREAECALQEQERIAGEALAHAENEVRRFAPLWTQAESLDAMICVAALESEKASADVALAQRILCEKRRAHAEIRREGRRLREALQIAQAELARLTAARVLSEQLSEIEDWIEKRAGFSLQCAKSDSQLVSLRRDMERDDALVASLGEADLRNRIERDRIAPLLDARAHALSALDEPATQMRGRAFEALSETIAALTRAARLHTDATREKENAARDLEAAVCIERAETEETAALQNRRALAEARREETERLGDLADATLSQEALRLRATLMDGEACPVCGGRAHPYNRAEDAVESLATGLRLRREELRATIADVDARLAQASRRSAAAGARAEDARRRIEKASRERSSAEADYSRAAACWPKEAVAPPIEIERAEPWLSQIAEDIAKERELVTRKLDHARLLRTEVDTLRKSHEECAKALDERRCEFQEVTERLAAARTEAARLEEQISGLRARIESVDRLLAPFLDASDLSVSDLDRDAGAAKMRLARKGEEYRVASGRVAELDAALSEVGLRMASAATEESEAARSEEEAETRAAVRSRKERGLQEERAALLEGEPTNMHRERVDANLKIVKESFQLASCERMEASLALATTSESVRLASRAVASSGEKTRIAQTAFLAGLAGAGLEEGVCLDLLAASPSGRNEIRATLDEAGQKAALAQAAEKERRRDLEDVLRDGRPTESRDDLSARATRLDNEIALLGEKLGADRERLAADEIARGRAGEIAAELEAADRLHKIWSEINAAIGSASGDKFRRFAQGVTLDHLVELANRHLSGLAPRYALERVSGDGGDLGLQIIDREMADERRSTRSLSGGERFLASLALALALCSLEGRESFVDTLFIDEGFGSLDASTLDIAIDALETLQGQGRRVGVISHVESLHQRIATQIRVEKRGGGKSVVTLPSS